MSVFSRVLIARAARNAAYGAYSVAFTLALAGHGFSPAAIGVLLSVALVAGAAFSLAAAGLVARFGRRSVLVTGGLVMGISGALFAIGVPAWTSVVAVLLGTVSAGTQEVGPFSALEQTYIAQVTGATAKPFAVYNVVGALAIALGALASGFVPIAASLWSYAVVGAVLAGVYLSIDVAEPQHRAAASAAGGPGERFGIVEKLTLLFGFDALAGGFVVQGFLAYWLHVRFGVDEHVLGPLFFGTNLLAAFSQFLAAPLAARIGLLETMVFTHLPSNVLLALVPLMPTFPLAAAMLLARFALSQMDVPTRQAYTMALVAPPDRARAASLTAAVRPAAAAVAPILSGLAMQGAAFGLPLFLAGGLKVVYDLAVYAAFRNVRVPES